MITIGSWDTRFATLKLHSHHIQRCGKNAAFPVHFRRDPPVVQLRESSTCLVIIFRQRLKLSSCCSCQSRDLKMWHRRNTADYATQCHTAAPVTLIMWDPHPLALPCLIAAQPSRFHCSVKLGVNSESIQDMPKQSCKARTNPRHPLAIPEERPALTRPCCPASGATPISRNVSISGTACGHILPLIITGRGRQKRQNERRRKWWGAETGCQGVWVTGVIRSIMALLWGAGANRHWQTRCGISRDREEVCRGVWRVHKKRATWRRWVVADKIK